MRSRAFTLIELLIVIAIIAILALIAVPNFLEAQVRAKVSRVASDMRSVSVAIGAYAVDFGRWPLSRGEANDAGVTPLSYDFPYIALTTPLAYMTTIPLDPFTEKGGLTKGGVTQSIFRHFDYTSVYKVNPPDVADNHQACWAKGFTWFLHSHGPTRSRVDPADSTQTIQPLRILSGGQYLFIYDSSNGTMSSGFIIRTNKGNYTGQHYEPK